MTKKKIIINADDYGLSKKFNSGILELIEKGIVTSTTVMVNKPFIKPKDLLKQKNISIGLHLELILDTPEKAIRDQLEKFRKMFGVPPSHLDGHRYYHLLPGNFLKVLKIAKKFKLPVRSASSADRKVMKDLGIKTPNRFVSWHPDRKDKLLKDLGETKDEITELLCHPGYFDTKSKTSYNRQRERELRILKGKQFRNLIRRFDLITYEQF